MLFIYPLLWFGSFSDSRFNLGSSDPVHSYVPEGRNFHFDSAYWTATGNTFLDKTGAILTDDKKSEAGGFWNSLRVSTRNWMIEVEFSCMEDKRKIHGDGIAFWLVPEILSRGSAFGADPHYTGAVITFDTYENRNHASRKIYPYLSLHVSDGTKPFIHDHDGVNTEIGGCSVQGSDEGRALRLYYIGIQKKFIVDVRARAGEQFTNCFEAQDVLLPTGYKFGFTAATGDLSDKHKITKVSFYNLDEAVKEMGMPHDFDSVKPSARTKTYLPDENVQKDKEHDQKKNERSIFTEIVVVFGVLCVFILILFVVHKVLLMRKKRLMKRLY